MTIEELQEQLNKAATSIQKLEAKNEELIGKLKTESARADDAESASGTELEQAIKRAEKAEREAKAANERADTTAKGLREFKASNALTAAIASANVDSDHVAMLTKAMRADIQFDDAGEPNIEGKTIEAYAKSFFSDAGKRYVRAADHSGGGASGSEGSKAPRMTKENFSYGEFAKIQLSNPEEANAIADAVGKPELKTSL